MFLDSPHAIWILCPTFFHPNCPIWCLHCSSPLEQLAKLQALGKNICISQHSSAVVMFKIRTNYSSYGYPQNFGRAVALTMYWSRSH
uniref:Uncharacterized protein n=1 Tax=Hippocampus comes TaxID=109280 RepID=A0A3Q2YFB6_HIPCM